VTDSNVNLNEESEKIYEEVLEIAKKIHPAAQVRPSRDISRGTWEIYIPTAFEEVRELPERFDGTPAAEAAELIGAHGVSALEAYARKKNYQKFPIDCAADYYNMENEQMRLYAEVFEANGGSRERALDELGPQFAGMRAMLDMKWLED
jgi:hypothetical protein